MCAPKWFLRNRLVPIARNRPPLIIATLSPRKSASSASKYNTTKESEHKERCDAKPLALRLTHAVRGEHDDLVFLESSNGIPHLEAQNGRENRTSRDQIMMQGSVLCAC
jgi:hypothetical protein